jgi:hypothetical protein
MINSVLTQIMGRDFVFQDFRDRVDKRYVIAELPIPKSRFDYLKP